MNVAIDRTVLSGALQQKIAGRRVRTALFTTFQFDPGFFETEVLPVLFERPYSPERDIRRVQLEEDVRQVEQIAVYFDRTGLIANESPVLDVRRISVDRRTGVFHPKVIALIVDGGPDDGKNSKPGRSLLLAVLSANLTQAGWWDNVECGEILEFPEKAQCPLRGDLLELVGSLRKSAPVGEDHAALKAVRKFVVGFRQVGQRSAGGVLHSRLFVGQSTMADFIRNVVRPKAGAYYLEIISPYFDRANTGTTVRNLIEQVNPIETRVYLPKGEDGTAQLTKGYFDVLREMDGVSWGKLDPAVATRSGGANGKAARFVHAKVYRLFSKSERREYLLVGSPNLSAAAHSKSNSGNLEVALVIETRAKRGQGFWMNEIKGTPGSFLEVELEEGVPEPCAPPVAIRFDWTKSVGEYLWNTDETPHSLTLSASGVAKGTIANVRAKEWTKLDADTNAAVAEVLRSTAFVTVDDNAGRVGVILIDELGMSQKPSLLLSLTPEQILRYWSLLSPAQRNAFLEGEIEKQGSGSGRTIDGISKTERVDSMFDGFAGIFHAFERLDSHLVTAIEAGNIREAEYRLFGRKYDSLQALIDKTLAPSIARSDSAAGPARSSSVNRYLTMLTAQQLLERIESREGSSKQWRAFLGDHRVEWHRLRKSLKLIKDVRNELDLGDGQSAEFLKWFEQMFMAEMKREEPA